jgi:hypothetical protein
MGGTRAPGKLVQGWGGHPPMAAPRPPRETSTQAVAEPPTYPADMEGGRVRGRTAARDACLAAESAASSPRAAVSNGRSPSPGRLLPLGLIRMLSDCFLPHLPRAFVHYEWWTFRTSSFLSMFVQTRSVPSVETLADVCRPGQRPGLPEAHRAHVSL